MPEEFGRYQLLELIGRGGMGEVYRALDTVRERTVALKLLPDYLAADESFKARFRRESRMAAKLNEPHIIPIHDFGEIDGRLYIDMRLVEGRDLGSLLESRGALQPDVAVDIVAQTAAALDAAHESGLVHRDVKPSNVLLTGLRDDPAVVPFAYLVDFGIARSATQEGTALTATTATVGTVAYMSPERINGKPGDRRTDIYALTCVLYESITGHKPYEGEIFAQMYAHVNTPPPLVSTWVPAATVLDAVIARGMAKDPEDRYGTAGDLAAAARHALRSGGVGWSGSAAADTRRTPSPPPSTPLPSAPPSGPPPTFTPPPYNQTYGSANPPTPPPYNQTYGSANPATPPPPSVPAEPAVRPPTYPTGSWPPTGTVPPVPRRSGSASRRNTVIAVAVAVVVAIVITIVLVNSGNSGSGAASTPVVHPSGSKGGSPTSSPSGQPSLNTGSAATPTVSWAHFASFSKLAGTKDDSPSSTWNSGDCTLGAPTSADASAGVADEVNCHYPGSTNVVTVARFDTAAREQAYLEQLLDQEGFRVLIWTSGGASRGLTYISPSAGTGLANISTTICGLPNYLVQIAAPDRTKTTALQLHDQIWDKVQFPDVMPPACDSTYLAAQAGAPVSAQSDVSKGVATMTSTDVTTLLQRGNSGLTVINVAVKTGIEAMVIGQAGTVTFWSEPDSTIEKVGTSTYPYAPSSLGPPNAKGQGALLTNMTDATFIVTGTFSGDGSGNAVAYTNGSKGWGAIKAEANGNLAPSGQGVAESGIGLSDGLGFTNGQLETIDCSSTLPISSCGGNQRVFKTWVWQSGQFIETGHSGLTK